MALATLGQEDSDALEASCPLKSDVFKESEARVREMPSELMYEKARTCMQNSYKRCSIHQSVERMDEATAGAKACKLAHKLVHMYVKREYWLASACARWHTREVASTPRVTPSRKSNTSSLNALDCTQGALHFHADRGTLGFEPSLRAGLMDACVTVSDFLLWPPSATWAILQLCDRLLHKTANVNIYSQFCGNHMRSYELEVAHQAYELFMNSFRCAPSCDRNTQESSRVNRQTRRFARCLLAFMLARIVNGVVSPIGQEEVYSTVLTFKNILESVYRVLALASDERVPVAVVTYMWNILTLQLLDGHLWTFDPVMYLQVPMYSAEHPESALALSGRCSGILKRNFDPSIGPSVAFPGQDYPPCEKCYLCIFPPPVVSSTQVACADRTFGAHSLYTSLLRPRLKPRFPYTVASTQDDLTVTSRMSTFCLLAAYVGVDGDAPVCDVAIVALLVEFRLWRRAAHLSGVSEYFDVFGVSNEIDLQDNALELTVVDWVSWSVERTEQDSQDSQRLQQLQDACDCEDSCNSQACRDSQDLRVSNPTPAELPTHVTSIYRWREEWVQNVARDVEALYVEALFPEEEVHPSYQKIASSYGTIHNEHTKCRTKVLCLVREALRDSPPLFTLVPQQPLPATEALPLLTSLGTGQKALESKKRALDAEVLEKETWLTRIAAPRDHLIQTYKFQEAEAALTLANFQLVEGTRTLPSLRRVLRHTTVATPGLIKTPTKGNIATRAKSTRKQRVPTRVPTTRRHQTSSC